MRELLRCRTRRKWVIPRKDLKFFWESSNGTSSSWRFRASGLFLLRRTNGGNLRRSSARRRSRSERWVLPILERGIAKRMGLVTRAFFLVLFCSRGGGRYYRREPERVSASRVCARPRASRSS